MRIIKKVRAPVRIDFGGGTTDIEPFASKYGGAVLNATINRYITGELIATNKNVKLQYAGHIPTSSGLGTSGVMNLVWLALISQTKNKIELAEKVYALEQSLGLTGGKQDQYASALGGINFLEFKGEKVKITKLKLREDLIKELEKKLVLIYTGKSHLSELSNKFMIENLKKGKSIKNLLRIKNIAKEMKKTLMKKNFDEFADLMNQETQERKLLHKSIIPLKIENIIKIGMKNGAIGAKVCGSGGGGSILFFGNKKKLKKKFKSKIIDFKFDFSGLTWL
ncbi:D-glycero-alpha-D-manno-heptose 7-phosphate kinase [subsurface metagenome]